MKSDINFGRFGQADGKKSTGTPAKGSVYFVLAVLGVIILVGYIILGGGDKSQLKEVDVTWKWEPGKSLEYDLNVTYRGDPPEVNEYRILLQASENDTLLQAFFMKNGQKYILTGLSWNPDLKLPAFYNTTQAKDIQSEILAMVQVLLTLDAKTVTKEIQKVERFPHYYEVVKRDRYETSQKILSLTGIITGEIQMDTEAEKTPDNVPLLFTGFVNNPSGTRWFDFKSKLIFDVKKENFVSCISNISIEKNPLYRVVLTRKKNWVKTSSSWEKRVDHLTENYNELKSKIDQSTENIRNTKSGSGTTIIKPENGNERSGQKNYEDYVVRSGDVLSKISKKFYGTTNKYRLIMDFNGLTSDRISIGQKLKIPHLTPKKKSSPNSRSRVTPLPKKYKKPPGNTGTPLDY